MEGEEGGLNRFFQKSAKIVCSKTNYTLVKRQHWVNYLCLLSLSAKRGVSVIFFFRSDSYVSTYNILYLGNATRLCDANGQWTGSEPKCQPIACGDPVTLPHTTVALINGSTSWKAVAQYSCIFGYHSSGTYVLLES